MATKKEEATATHDPVESRVTIFSGYAIMQRDPQELAELIRSNFGGAKLKQASLDRVKVPTGGITTWQVPTLAGEVETKHIDGVIVAWREPRAYWKAAYTGGGAPPDCSSPDSNIGVGDPGGECDLCAFAKFGSARRPDGSPSDAQACRQVRLMAVLQQADFMPLLLAAPPGSLGSLDRYFMRLSRSATPYFGVVTRFALRKVRSKAGQEYSEIEPTAIETLSAEARNRVSAYSKAFSSVLEAQGATGDEFAG